jgi:hypothetical protein
MFILYPDKARKFEVFENINQKNRNIIFSSLQTIYHD